MSQLEVPLKVCLDKLRVIANVAAGNREQWPFGVIRYTLGSARLTNTGLTVKEDDQTVTLTSNQVHRRELLFLPAFSALWFLVCLDQC